MKKQNGITLISLIITIIIMLIIAGVALSTAFGDNSMISQALKASEETSEKAQIEEQAIKNASDYVYQKTNLSNPEYSHSDAIAEGAYYGNLNMSTMEFNLYTEMPETVSDGDIYLYSDYIYVYDSTFYDPGWRVRLATAEVGITTYIPDYPVVTMNQSTYSKTILDKINNVPVTDVRSLYQDCTSLTNAKDIHFPIYATSWEALFLNCTSLTEEGLPTIPNHVEDLLGTFNGCTSLVNLSNYIIPSNVHSLDTTFANCTSLTMVPNLSQASNLWDLWETFSNCTSLVDASTLIIPSSVPSIRGVFQGCTSLATAPTIPNTVTEMYHSFYNCTNLTGNITINANPNSYEDCFKGTTKPITITGSCSSTTKTNLAGTSSNGNVSY